MAKETKRAKGEKMNKEYWEYYFSKKKKLTDRAFKLRIAMLMTSMLACAAVMASSAFALFTCDINRTTTLTAASFEVLGWNPIQQTSDDINITHVVDIYTTPGVLGYCRIPVYGADKTIHYYFTEAFSSGHMQVSIATASGASVGKPEGYWGNPRNFLGPEAEIIGNGALVTHSYAVPQQEDSSGSGEGTGGMLTTARPSSGADVSEDTPITDNATEAEKGTVTEEKSIETTAKAENSETTVTPSVSEEKASAEVSNSTVTETPVSSSPPPDSGNASDSGNTTAADSSHSSTSGKGSSGSSESNSSSSATSDSSVGSSSSTSAPVSSASSGDSGTSSGSDASAGGSPPSSSDGGGE
ncbi:MAG: hypothetical protein IJF32_02125, partial [Oscillospiraceae bacterium]|nr:hypothetical protein [Oscillospiraceae bacterium]